MKSLIVCLFAGLALSLLHSVQAGPPGGGSGGRGDNSSDAAVAADGPGGGRPKGPPGQGPPGQGPPGQGPPGQGGHQDRGGPGDNGGGPLEQLMALDTNGDGALTPAEVTDPRLQQMLKQADTNANGAVTRAELMSAMNNNQAGKNQGGQPRGGPGGPGGPPRPGEILPGFIQEQLQLTDTQRQQLNALQMQVDAQLAQILTAQQLQQLASGPQGPVGGGQGQFAGGPNGGPNGGSPGKNAGSRSGPAKSGRSGKGSKQ